MDMGFYISFSGIVTFKKSVELQAVAKKMPADRLLVETDAPYLAPVPQRGKRNEPAFVAHVAAFLGALRGETQEDIAVQTTANFHALFKHAVAT
jgi:TatD DNase family protein